ncbi:MAG: ribosome maturation factor RimP [Deltaproteobacteria bacterium]|nr:ribosome maturation factor RimP [Deltaproteobacteria bacterium]
MSGAPISRSAGLTRDELVELIAPICAAHRCALVTIEWTRDRTLRVLIEREGLEGPADPSTGLGAGAGITLEDCQRVSRDLSAALDVNDPIPGSYRLEVSSPGLNRPLVGEKDFRRFVGTRAKVELREPIEGRRRFDGRIESVDSGTVVLVQDGKPTTLRIDDIAKAHLVWEPPARGGRGPRKSS